MPAVAAILGILFVLYLGYLLVVAILLAVAYTFLSLSSVVGHPAIVAILLAAIGAGIGLAIFHGQERGQTIRSDEDYAVWGSLRFTAEEWAARLLVMLILVVAVYGVVVAGPRAKDFAASEQARLSSLITSAVVAREISNHRPIDTGNMLQGPKTSAAIYVEYAGANAGRDSIVASLAWGSGTSSCQPWTIPNRNGSYYCRWGEVYSGNYTFHISVNGKHLRSIPFRVLPTSADAPDGNRASDRARNSTCSHKSYLNPYEWLEMKRNEEKQVDWNTSNHNACIIVYSDIDGEKKQCANEHVSMNVKEKIWFRAEKGVIQGVCFRGLSFVRRCRECR